VHELWPAESVSAGIRQSDGRGARKTLRSADHLERSVMTATLGRS